ncbi:unnamed protein product [Thlaspi arvense]|uniref:Ubiquitin-like protease family profile domain-containing protein n=1 Tax=Thlaspi arvense TaxID=13288 RepID=A0AAU9R9C6_THLAR|nr:unnamed protein product [Thlaspi arvense]
MLLYILSKLCPDHPTRKSRLQPFQWQRLTGLYVNHRGGDCGPVAVKFMEMHLNNDPHPGMAGLTDKMVNEFRKKWAMEIYKDAVIPLYFPQ